MFGKYKSLPKKLEPYYLFIIKPIKDVTKRNRTIRKLFGRKEDKYCSKGLIDERKGKQLSPISFIIPIRLSEDIFSIFKKEKVDYRFYEIWSDQFF